MENQTFNLLFSIPYYGKGEQIVGFPYSTT